VCLCVRVCVCVCVCEEGLRSFEARGIDRKEKSSR